jgi:cyanophycin synthetase
MKIIKVQHFVDQIFGVSKEKIKCDWIGGNGTIPTNKIDGFKERIEAMLPTLIEHRCSEGCRGIFSRVERGTWMGHVIEHIALEIQTLAVWTQDLVELARLKHLGPTMLFSVIPKRIGLSPQNQPLRLPNP